MKTQITALKLARYLDRLEGPLRPIHWDVDPSTVCDHTCTGCPYIYDGERDPMLGVMRPGMVKQERGFLDVDLFETFLADAKARGCEAITFVGGGEPTMHPLFRHLLIATADAGVKFGVVTHLGRKLGSVRDLLAELKRATWIRVSINAGTAETYLRHQGRNHFAQVRANIRLLCDRPRDMRLGVSFLITADNWKEIGLAADNAWFDGADYIQYKPLVTTPTTTFTPELRAAIGGRLRTVHEKFALTERFQILDQWGARKTQLDRHDAGEFFGACHVARFNPKLGADGVVYQCCELAYSTEGRLGSLHEEPLAAILDRAQGRVVDQARCPHCWAKPVNTAINEGRAAELAPPPPSVDQEFV